MYDFLQEEINLDRLRVLGVTHEPLSYKELCEELEMKPKSGDSKIAQLNGLKTICDYHITSRPTRYIIDKYYEEYAAPLMNDKAKYVPYVETILCALLTTGEPIIASISDLMIMCRIVNNNFKAARIKNNQANIAEGRNVSLVDLQFFVDITYGNILAPIIRSALNSMEKRKVIKIAPAYRYKQYIDEQKKNFIMLPAAFDSQMFKAFHDIEYAARKELGLENKRYIPNDMINAYRLLCNQKTREQFHNIEYFYSCKEIVTQKKIIESALPSAYTNLNVAVGQRVMTAKSLDDLTMTVRKILSKDMLSLDPAVDYKKFLGKNEI